VPIRTQRGRAAVYRKLWGWPLRSPLHLVVVVLAVALIAAVSVLASEYARDAGPGQAGHDPQAAGNAPAVSTSSRRPEPSATPSAPRTRGPGPTATPRSRKPSRQALTVATKWAKAWVHHPEGITTKQWLAGMKPYTTPEFLPVMASIDPANIPASKVTGKPHPRHSYTSSLQVVLPTDGPKLDVTVIKTDSGWRVAHYSKAS
jgi:hypothetical protein